MRFEEMLLKRESCRSYRDSPVAREDLEKICRAGILSPSACNSQPWKFLVVDEPEAREKLCDALLLPNGKTGAPWREQCPAFIVLVEQKANVMPIVLNYYHDSQYFARGDLEMAAQSGVEVTVVIPSVADHWYAYAVAKAFCARLLAAGVKIYTYTPGFIHSKTFVWDGAGAVVGSVNLDFRSLYTHFEAGVWLRGGEAVAQTEEDLQAILRVSDPMHPEDCKPKGLLKGLLYGLLRLFAPLM